MHGDAAKARLQTLWDHTHEGQPRPIKKYRVEGDFGHVRKYWLSIHDQGNLNEKYRILGTTYAAARRAILSDVPAHKRSAERYRKVRIASVLPD